MANIITDYDSVKSKLFTLTKSHYYSDQYKTLEVKYDSQNFYIQTPYIINRYSPSNYESKITLDIPLDFSNVTEDSIDDISILYIWPASAASVIVYVCPSKHENRQFIS